MNQKALSSPGVLYKKRTVINTMVDTLIQYLVNGVTFGFLYALIAIEYTLVFNACRLLNFSHIQIIAYGAFVFAGTFVIRLGWPLWLGYPAAMAVLGVFGALISIVIFNPLRNVPRTYAIIATMMLSNVMLESTNFIWGPIPFTLLGFLSGITHISTAAIATANVFIIGVAVVVVVLLLLFMNKTKLGKAMRCVAENRDAAEYMGINVKQNMMLTTAMSCMICCIIGIMIIPLFQVRNTMAAGIGMKGFVAGIVGSFGSVPGAILGGILVGLLENFALLIVPSVYKDITSFVLVLVVLMFKPNGLLSRNPNKGLKMKAKKTTKVVETSD